MVYPGHWSMSTWEVYSWWRSGEKGTLVHSWWECKLVQPLWTTVGRLLKNLKTELSHDPPFSASGHLPRENENTNLKRYMHFYVHGSIVYNAQETEKSWVPTRLFTGHKFPGCSLVAQMVKNLPAMGKTRVWPLGSGRSPGERERLPSPVFLPREFQGQRSLADYSPCGHKELDMTERLTLWLSSVP